MSLRPASESSARLSFPDAVKTVGEAVSTLSEAEFPAWIGPDAA
jgi:hypothetical protein